MAFSAALPVLYEIFAHDLMSGLHDLGNDPLGAALTNAAPNPILHETRSQISEIGAGAGYPVGGIPLPGQTLTRVGKTSILSIPEATRLATDEWPIWRWVVLFNMTNDRLILSWDWGAPGVALQDADLLRLRTKGVPLSSRIVNG